MPVWFPGLVLALLIGVVASLYLWLIRRRKEECASGLQALAGMRWRDFSRLALAAMEQRGYRRVATGGEDAREQGTSFLLQEKGGGKPLLLTCKHGSAYRIGPATIDEIASDIRLRGAHGGVLVTEGTLDAAGRDRAVRNEIEVLSGARLWAELKPLLDIGLRGQVVDGAAARAKRHIGIAWLGAVAAGAVAAVALPGVSTPPVEPAPAARAPAATPPTTTPAPLLAEPGPPRPAATEADLEKERLAVSRAIARVDGLTRGIWISRSTLAVDRETGEERAWSLVCAELARHPDLTLTRVQMNPPPGSDEQVRWRQCEAIRR
ncbi:MAG: restriction endonuclease [Pseudoxanthomonas sp.]